MCMSHPPRFNCGFPGETGLADSLPIRFFIHLFPRNWLNHATGYASQHVWCLSQDRTKWKGCGRKGISHKNGGMIKVGRWLVQMQWHPSGWSVCLPLPLHHKVQRNISSGIGSPGKSWKKGCKMVVCVCVPRKPLWTSGTDYLQARCPSCHPTNSVKAMEKVSTDPNQWPWWPHPFFIYHQIPEGRGTAPFTPALQRQYAYNENIHKHTITLYTRSPSSLLLWTLLWPV